jgi:hypothetical protein
MCGNSKERRPCPGSTTDTSDIAAHLIFGVCAFAVNAIFGTCNIGPAGERDRRAAEDEELPPGAGRKAHEPAEGMVGWGRVARTGSERKRVSDRAINDEKSMESERMRKQKDFKRGSQACMLLSSSLHCLPLPYQFLHHASALKLFVLQ